MSARRPLSKSIYWSAAREWPGETAFIVAGGPSVSGQPLELLAGRRVIAVNSSWERLPDADFLFFGDARWWRKYGVSAAGKFIGRIVTCASVESNAQVLRMRLSLPPGLAQAPDTVKMRKTSLSGAINLAVHLGVDRIVLLGADGRAAADGRTHHHKPHPWPINRGCWEQHRDELQTLVAPLEDLGIGVVNCSPGTAWKMWAVANLADTLSSTEADRKVA